MEKSLIKSSAELRHQVLNLLWRQWSALGVAGHVSMGGKSIVDPEALILLSTVFARDDARLFDEIVDWLNSNGIWINVQRLSRLQSEFGLGKPSVLGAIAEHLSRESANAKWKVLMKRDQKEKAASSLFSHLPAPNAVDEIFRKWGWLRPPIEVRGLSRSPRPSQPSALLLKLRGLFGRQSRAEVFAWLLTHPSGHPAQIAREVGYFRGSVQNVLNELEACGFVFATRQGREKHFVAPNESWRFLITRSGNEVPEFPRWMPWAALFTLVRRFLEFAESLKAADVSIDLQAIELKRLLSPLVARLVSEGFRAEGFDGNSVTDLFSRFDALMLELSE